MKKMRVGILTGGGDCAGLNAAIKWVVYAAIDRDVQIRYKTMIEVIAIKEGWEGILMLDPEKGLKDERYVQVLTDYVVRKIDRDGGTAIGTSRTNPFNVKGKDGKSSDESATVVQNIKTLALDALIAVGGEDTLGVANKLYQKYGVPVVGIPKTIDLDLPGTEYSLGFDSAVNNIKLLIDHARTVAGSHRKTAVVEVMGRHSGFLAMAGGMVSSAHFILIPEYPFEISKLVSMINDRKKLKSRYTLVVVAEGAKEAAILAADGQAQARLRVAQAEAQAIQVVAQAIGQAGNPAQYLIAQRYLESLTNIAAGAQKVVFLPFEATGVMASLGGIRELLQASSGGPAAK